MECLIISCMSENIHWSCREYNVEADIYVFAYEN